MNTWRVVRKSRNTGRVLRVLFVGTLADCDLWLSTFGRTGCTKNTWNTVER